ncbi:MAG: hypothetical protein LUG99_08965 [Lachnospiraceae bacterium]|nr:hypothetical protein [Lachnospiraceae bacterium]
MADKNFKIPTPAELEAMRDVDIRTVDKDTLTDIRDVNVDNSLPQKERILDFIRQVGNPYCYKVGDIAVKVSFAGKCSLEDAVKDCILAGM